MVIMMIMVVIISWPTIPMPSLQYEPCWWLDGDNWDDDGGGEDMEPTCPWTALRRTVCQVRTVWSKLTKWLSSQVTLPGILTVMGCMVRMSPIPGSFYSNLSESSPHKPISIFKVIENFDEICKTDMWNRYREKKRIFTGFRSAFLKQGPVCYKSLRQQALIILTCSWSLKTFMLEKQTQPHQKVFLSPRSVSTIPAPEKRGLRTAFIGCLSFLYYTPIWCRNVDVCKPILLSLQTCYCMVSMVRIRLAVSMVPSRLSSARYKPSENSQVVTPVKWLPPISTST